MELGQGEGSRLELLPQGWRRRGRAAGLGKCQVPHYVCAPGRWHHKSEDFHKDLTDLAGQMRPQHDYRCVQVMVAKPRQQEEKKGGEGGE